MVLVDTAIWVSHLKKGDTSLKSLLEDGEVLHRCVENLARELSIKAAGTETATETASRPDDKGGS